MDVQVGLAHQFATLFSTVFVEIFGETWTTSTRLLSVTFVSALLYKFCTWISTKFEGLSSLLGQSKHRSVLLRCGHPDTSRWFRMSKWIVKNHPSNVTHVRRLMDGNESALIPAYFKPIRTTFESIEFQIMTKKPYGKPSEYDIPYPIVEIKSKTASYNQIDQFIEHCVSDGRKSDNDQPINSELKLHVFRVEKASKKSNDSEKEQGQNSSWKTSFVTTNKDLSNTILSKTVERNLLDEVDHFVSNEEWYAKKGIPYKRGFLLHGPGGTGKTSIIKAIAVKYKAEVFSLSMSEIKSDTMLINAVAEIRSIAVSKYVILALEDLDRSEIFSPRGYFAGENRPNIQGLLQVLDGINENYAQITFITANNPQNIEQASDVLFRPGRIDKRVEITYCDEDQVIRMTKHYYEQITEEYETLLKEVSKQIKFITPAGLMQLFRVHENVKDLILALQNTNDDAVAKMMKPEDDNDNKRKTRVNLMTNRKARLRSAISKTKSSLKKVQKLTSEQEIAKKKAEEEKLTKRLTSQMERLEKLKFK